MDDQYSQRLQKIEAVLTRTLPHTPNASWYRFAFSELAPLPPNALTRSLTEPGRDLVSRGGKRWRPLLMTLICEALGGGDRALELVPVIEFCHNASLIHDDIEDCSDARRGKPAVHLLYGEDTAINAGSFLYFLGGAAIDAWQASDEQRLAVYKVWAEHMRRLHLGQAMDIAWHRDFSSLPSIEDYELMCRLKTGVLARLAAQLGALAANAEPAIQKRLARAAEDLGVGFQILDDVKNLTTGNPGKQRGDDIVEGKKSLPILLYLHEDASRAAFVRGCFQAARARGCTAPEVERLIGELTAHGCIAAANARGKELIAAAGEALRGTTPAESDEAREAGQLLRNLISLIS